MSEPLSYDIDQAAARLGSIFTRDFLENRISELPHIKTGEGRGRAGRVGFSEEHLQQIIRMFSVDPAPSTPAYSGPVTRRRQVVA